MLIATLRNTTTATNLRRDGRVSLEIIQGEDAGGGHPGHHAPHQGTHDLQRRHGPLGNAGPEVKLDTSPAQRVFQGPASEPRNEKAAAFEKAGVAELMVEAQKR